MAVCHLCCRCLVVIQHGLGLIALTGNNRRYGAQFLQQSFIAAWVGTNQSRLQISDDLHIRVLAATAVCDAIQIHVIPETISQELRNQVGNLCCSYTNRSDAQQQ